MNISRGTWDHRTLAIAEMPGADHLQPITFCCKSTLRSKECLQLISHNPQSSLQSGRETPPQPGRPPSSRHYANHGGPGGCGLCPARSRSVAWPHLAAAASSPYPMHLQTKARHPSPTSSPWVLGLPVTGQGGNTVRCPRL